MGQRWARVSTICSTIKRKPQIFLLAFFLISSFWFVFSGLVGKVGQNSLTECAADLNKAKDIFKKKWDDAIRKKKPNVYLLWDGDELETVLFCHRFLDKTKNEWEHRENFEKVAGKYDMVFMDYSTEEKVRNKDPKALICSLPHRLWFILPKTVLGKGTLHSRYQKTGIQAG